MLSSENLCLKLHSWRSEIESWVTEQWKLSYPYSRTLLIISCLWFDFLLYSLIGLMSFCCSWDNFILIMTSFNLGHLKCRSSDGQFQLCFKLDNILRGCVHCNCVSSCKWENMLFNVRYFSIEGYGPNGKCIFTDYFLF